MNSSFGNWNSNPYQQHSSPRTSPPQSQVADVGPYDVLCGRDREAFNNVGNRRFRVTVSMALDSYVNAKSRQDKGLVIVSIINKIRGNGGKFIKWKKDRYVELTEKQMKEKVGHCLRDLSAARDGGGRASASSSYKGSVASSMKEEAVDARKPAAVAGAAEAGASGANVAVAVAARHHPQSIETFSGHHPHHLHHDNNIADHSLEDFSDISDQDLANLQQDSEENVFSKGDNIFEG